MSYDEKWLREHYARLGKPIPAGMDADAGGEAPKRSKYGNRRTEYKGRVFDSKHEADEYAALELQVRAGALRAVLCQVPFLLPGGVKYVADFVVLNNDGTYSVLDAKSDATRMNSTYRIKKRQMRECLNITIEEV